VLESAVTQGDSGRTKYVCAHPPLDGGFHPPCRSVVRAVQALSYSNRMVIEVVEVGDGVEKHPDSLDSPDLRR
jgi:hypothetical protein